MSFCSRSCLATASNSSWLSAGASAVSLPRISVHPVPVYSQYMSISSDSSALRTFVVPVIPVSSCTVAPASSSARMAIWPRTNCSVNSLDPTVKDLPDSSPLPPLLSSPPHPARVRASPVASTIRRAFFEWRMMASLFIVVVVVIESQPTWAQAVFGNAGQVVYEQGEHGHQGAADDADERPVARESRHDQRTQRAGPDERTERGGADVDGQRGAEPGHDHRHRQR